MPRVDGRRAGGVVVPGMWRALVERRCRSAAGPDPRLFLNDPDPVKWERLVAAGRAEAYQMLGQRLQERRPVVVQRWELTGVGLPADVPLFADRSIRWWSVTADDVVSPAPSPVTAAPR